MTDVALQSGSPEIPDKLYFKIGEVSELLGVEPYVLRYWGNRIPGAVAQEIRHGTSAISTQDVELLLRIKHLLYEKRFTIEGARQSLEAARALPSRAQPDGYNRSSSPRIRYPKYAESWPVSCRF